LIFFFQRCGHSPGPPKVKSLQRGPKSETVRSPPAAARLVTTIWSVSCAGACSSTSMPAGSFFGSSAYTAFGAVTALFSSKYCNRFPL
jgi:hypothetical protein